MGILQVACCLESFHYVIHGDRVNFEKARENCQHEGDLTSLATEEELRAVQEAVLQQEPAGGTHTYWIGLWRRIGVCHAPDKMLKGFEWITGGDDAQGIKWKAKPPETCTNDRCAYISITHDGTSAKDWGLVSDACKREHPFICKVKGEKKIPAPKDCAIPVIGGTHDHIHMVGQPSTLDVICKDKKTYNLTCSLETLTWTTVDGMTVDFSGLCVPCPEGYEKSGSDQCVDINECEKQPCGSESVCINTVGSYHCVDILPQPTKAALPEDDAHTDPPHTNTEGALVTQKVLHGTPSHGNVELVDVTPASPDYSYIYIPVVVAVLALLLLLVLILAIVACCRRRKRRRSKSLAGKKASKESMALRDSMEKVNDK